VTFAEPRPVVLDVFPLPGRRDVRSSWHAARDGGARRHEGTDIYAPPGTVVRAPFAGRVAYTTSNPDRPCGFGIAIERADRGARVLLCHFGALPLFDRAELVNAGDVVGVVGASGNATVRGVAHPHLHIALEVAAGPGRWRRIDPAPSLLEAYEHGSQTPQPGRTASAPPSPPRSASGLAGGALALAALVVASSSQKRRGTP
jgi:peptidoglycan LD-endopeptidase LytH